MSVFKRKGSPFYWYDFTISGNRFRGSTETDDLQAARAVEAKLRTDTILNKHLKRKPRMTLDIALGRFWTEHGQYRASAFDAMQGYARNLLGHFDKNIYLDEIGDAEISSYKASCIGKVSNATINRRLAYMRSVMNKARKEWGIDTGDLEINKHLLDEPEARTRWITPDEADQLIKEAAPHLKPCIRFALLTGLRLNNITALRWEQIKLQERVISFKVKSSLPGRKLHVIPISDALFSLLMEQKPRKDGFVFLRHFKNKKPVPITKFRRSFATACQKAGIEDFRFHDLRHTAASWMRQNGVPIEVVQKVLGHANIATTMKYAHLHDDEKAQALNTLAMAQYRHNGKKGKRA